MSEPTRDLRTQLAQAFSRTATANGRRLGPLRFELADAALAVFDDQAAERVAREMWERVRLRELAFRDGSAHMELTEAQQLAAGFVAAARALLDGTENYTEITFTAKVAESPQSYVFTVRRSEGLTPHQLRERAEEERDMWKRAAEAETQGGKARAEMLVRVEGALAQLRDLAANPGTHRPNFPRDMAFAAHLLDDALNGTGAAGDA
jgi:hypothetical protein